MGKVFGMLNSINGSVDKSYKLISISDLDINEKVYCGADPKFGVTVCSTDYVCKLQKKSWNNVLSEYVGSNVIRILGGNTHEVFLGDYKGSQVALCKDFSDGFMDMKSMYDINESSIDTDLRNHDYFYNDIIHVMSKVRGCNIEQFKKDFLRMYVFDTILGNPDRHQGNWGIGKLTDCSRVMAPIYDNGASLYPRAKLVKTDLEWMREHVETFPNSKIMFGNVRETSSYYKMWRDAKVPEYAVSYAETLDISKAVEWITNNPLLTTEVAEFYAWVIMNRFQVIVCGGDYVY